MATKSHGDDQSPANGDMPEPGFEFGVFDFQELSDWLINSHRNFAGWLMETAGAACEEIEDDSPLYEAYQGVPMAIVVDTAYLAMLSVVVGYSIRENVLKGGLGTGDLIAAESFRRARYMLGFHADCLPVRIDDEADDGGASVLDRRAGDVSAIMAPLWMTCFRWPGPLLAKFASQMPMEIRAAWGIHKYSHEPPCHMAVVSFWRAFGAMVRPGCEAQHWGRMLHDFWDEWIGRLMSVHFAVEEEDLQGRRDQDPTV
jgi:hypothetical protein